MASSDRGHSTQPEAALVNCAPFETIDGKQIIERLDAIDNPGRFYRYTNIAGLPVANYTGMLSVQPKGAGSFVEWRAQFLPNGPGTLITKTIVATLFKTGLDSLKSRF